MLFKRNLNKAASFICVHLLHHPWRIKKVKKSFKSSSTQPLEMAACASHVINSVERGYYSLYFSLYISIAS